MVDSVGSFNEDIDENHVYHVSLRPEVLLADAMQFEVCDLGRHHKKRHIGTSFPVIFLSERLFPWGMVLQLFANQYTIECPRIRFRVCKAQSTPKSPSLS